VCGTVQGRDRSADIVDRVFYWFGAYYDKSLLIQAALMIGVQLILLKVALDNKAPSGVEHAPFSGYSMEGTWQDILSGKRPFNFWRWNNARP
jgi:solute carrier family 66, member 2